MFGAALSARPGAWIGAGALDGASAPWGGATGESEGQSGDDSDSRHVRAPLLVRYFWADVVRRAPVAQIVSRLTPTISPNSALAMRARAVSNASDTTAM